MTKDLPMFYKLGETKEEIHIDTAEENRNTAISLMQQARYSIDIFSQDLDAELYSNKEVEHAIFKLAKRHPDAKIRILTQDSQKAVGNGHRLIQLAQRLTSSVFINNPSEQHKDEKSAFLVVDRVGLLYRDYANNRNYTASASFMSPRWAAKLTDLFDEIWEHSTADIQTRRLYV